MIIERLRAITEYFPSLIVAIVLHEFAHALAAYAFGDESAKSQGRLSLNPLKHLDITGIFCLIIFKFGWAKPVPIDSKNFKNYNLGMFVVSIAGILMNFLIAFIAAQILKHTNITEKFLLNFLVYSVIINVNLAVFNLIPIPPLDGSNILLSFFPKSTAYYVSYYRTYTQFILLFLIASGFVSKMLGYVVKPIVELLML